MGFIKRQDTRKGWRWKMIPRFLEEIEANRIAHQSQKRNNNHKLIVRYFFPAYKTPYNF
jgi:hypothetical protein